ncbi:sugar ABC transporter substrate-binding protein [Gorillibacterium massiliense]|uniref:sugar ABC transporter substrate-binding protein n=1 Tax=Gorillibacterium massiliense TaxID=1280390 RepID=UPI0004B7E829|nr:sugar ABC transporter substrate-binding protein [Gorillibacterium massiliense]
MKKSILSILAILLVLSAFTACSSKANNSGGDNSSSGGKKPFTIAFANVNDVYAYCVKVREYLKELAGNEGMKVLVANGAGDVKTQNDQIDNFIVQKADMIAAISIDLDGSVPAVENAKAANIPYISLLTHVNTDGYIYIGSENKQAGEVQGEYLAKVLPQNAKVLYMTGQTNDQQYVDRKAGLTEKLFNARPDVKLLAEQSSDNQKDKGMSLTEDWLQQYPEFDAIISQNDDAALGAIEALKAANRLNGVTVVGIDGSDEALKSIEAGEMTMTVFQDAKAQAQAVVDVAKKIRDGEDSKSITNIMIPFKTVTKENVGEVK